MTQGDTVEVTLLSGRGWHGTVAGYTERMLKLVGPLWYWEPGQAYVEIIEYDSEEYQEVLLPWPQVECVEVMK